ncbi:polysaccharide deacetylase [Paenibacillaceae bacterium]|nr:polysaccharide deacetylase [Paenibacillaceae bacterium]
MTVVYDLFPGGKPKAVTLSYDDGIAHDQKMIEVLNRYGLKGTFHLISGAFGKPGFVAADEVKALYANHEIAAHTVTHPNLPHIPQEMRVWEVMEDRRALERIAGYPVKGMSYPFGTYSDEVARLLPSLGIAYCRTTISNYSFELPENFHQWTPTCHHNEDLLARTQAFLDESPMGKPQLFYVWGHSFEFADDNNWELLEQFAETIGRHDSVWYATNKQIVDYTQALRRLEVSVDGSLIYNPSALSVWITANGLPAQIKPGTILEVANDKESND